MNSDDKLKSILEDEKLRIKQADFVLWKAKGVKSIRADYQLASFWWRRYHYICPMYMQASVTARIDACRCTSWLALPSCHYLAYHIMSPSTPEMLY